MIDATVQRINELFYCSVAADAECSDDTGRQQDGVRVAGFRTESRARLRVDQATPSGASVSQSVHFQLAAQIDDDGDRTRRRRRVPHLHQRRSRDTA